MKMGKLQLSRYSNENYFILFFINKQTSLAYILILYVILIGVVIAKLWQVIGLSLQRN